MEWFDIVIIPDAVSSIGKDAFYATNVTSVDISKNITSIGSGAFSHCKNLLSISVDSENSNYSDRDGVLFATNETEFHIFPAGKDIESYSIPDGVKSISESAFAGNIYLNSITIPDSLTSIDSYAFVACKNLNDITIPNGVTHIGNRVFLASGVTSIIIPNSLTSIGYAAFRGTTNLTSITVGSGNSKFTDIDGVLFSADENELHTFPAGRDVEIYSIPDGVKSIGYKAFAESVHLRSITIPDSLTYIDNRAFAKSSLPSLIIPGNVYISWGAFSGSNVTSITLLPGHTSIDNFAFENAEKLTSVTLPEGMTVIGNGAFRGSSSLTSITIPDSVTHIGNGAFERCASLKSITIPANITYVGGSAFGDCSSLTYIDVAPDSPIFTQIDGVLFNKKEKLLHTFPMGKDFTSYAIPDGILTIGYDAFKKSKMTSITIPDTVHSIWTGAFRESNLTSLTIPNGVTSIASHAFQNSISLTSVILSDTVTYIGRDAFQSCKNLTSVIIPDSVTYIADYAFRWSDKVELFVVEGSYAHQYAINENIPYSLIAKTLSSDKNNTWQEIDKTYSTLVNLRIRKEEGLENASLFTLPTFSPIKVLAYGTEEEIDGITAKWLQVEITADIESFHGKEIEKGTVGWCFGGYVTSIPEPGFATQTKFANETIALIEAGANLDTQDEYGMTLLLEASKHGQTEVLSSLINAGADLEAKNSFGMTALMTASYYGHTNSVTALIDAGANLDLQDDYNLWTALMYATAKGHTESVSSLIEGGANLNAQNNDGETAVLLASKYKQTEIENLLTRAGAQRAIETTKRSIDYRQVLFGNNYQNIKEIDADSFFEQYPEVTKNYHAGNYYGYGDNSRDLLQKNYYHVYEQIIGETTFYRVVLSHAELSEVDFDDWNDVRFSQYVFLRKSNTDLLQLGENYEFGLRDGTKESASNVEYSGLEIIERNDHIIGIMKYTLVNDYNWGSVKDYGRTIARNTAFYYTWSDILQFQSELLPTISHFTFKENPAITIVSSAPLIDNRRPFMYTIQNAFDGNPATSFVEYTTDNLLSMHFEFPSDYTFTDIALINGYAQSESIYQSNNRLKTITFPETSTGAEAKYNLEGSTLGYQEFTLENAITQSSASIDVIETYEGMRYTDTSLAELDIYIEGDGWLFGLE